MKAIAWLSTCVCVAMFVSTLPIARATDDAVPAHAKALMGCWQAERGNAFLVRFEPSRCTYARDGEFQVCSATYKPGEIVLKSWGKTTSWKPILTKEGLLLVIDREGRDFRKLSEVPAALDPKPLALREPTTVPEDRVKAIRVELARRDEDASKVRSREANPHEKRRVLADNLQRLKSLVAEVGWIDATRFGAETSEAACRIALDSRDVSVMMAALPRVEEDFKAERMGAGAYALLYDCLKLTLGEKQRYGTQSARNENGECVIPALEDRNRVEQLRKEIGLFPFAQFLDYLKREAGAKDVKVEVGP